MNRWIPAIEKLPEKDELYIVTFDGELARQKEPFTFASWWNVWGRARVVWERNSKEPHT